MPTRHEDDLRAEAYATGGAVPFDHVLEHLDHVVAHPEAYGSSVTEPLRALLEVVRGTKEDCESNGVAHYFPSKIFIRTTEL